MRIVKDNACLSKGEYNYSNKASNRNEGISGRHTRNMLFLLVEEETLCTREFVNECPFLAEEA